MGEEGAIFNDLQKEVNKTTQTAQDRLAMISEANWRLEDKRMSLRQIHTVGQQEIQAETRIF